MKGFLNKVQGKPANNSKSVDGKPVATQSSIPTKNTPFFGGHQATPSASSLATLSQAADTLRSNPHIAASTYQ